MATPSEQSQSDYLTSSGQPLITALNALHHQYAMNRVWYSSVISFIECSQPHKQQLQLTSSEVVCNHSINLHKNALPVLEPDENSTTVEPPNRGHLGEKTFVLISEVVLI